jgi:hypothetical protein
MMVLLLQTPNQTSTLTPSNQRIFRTTLWLIGFVKIKEIVWSQLIKIWPWRFYRKERRIRKSKRLRKKKEPMT